MQTLDQFIKTTGLRMTAKRVDANPHMADSANMDHWRCTISGPDRRRMVVPFSMGYGHNGKEPKLADVLDCLASDAHAADEMFETWCSEFGYDPDSRTAERIYKTVRKQTDKLRSLVGHRYDELLYDTERL